MRTYTEEFMRQAVELADSLYSISGAAKQLGISGNNIYLWRSKLKNIEKPVKTSALTVSEADELKRLRKENIKLKKANYILKSAAAFFSQDTRSLDLSNKW